MKENELGAIINELYQKKEKSNLQGVVSRYMQTFLDAYKNHEIYMFSKESNQYDDQLEALLEFYQLNKSITKEESNYCAMLYTIKILSDKMAQMENQVVEDYSSYRYIYMILGVLYVNGPISSGRIADELKIERHNLHNAMRRANKFKLWTKRQSGRNVIYQITYKGEEAYLLYKQKQIMNNSPSFTKVINLLLNLISDNMTEPHPDVNSIIRKLNSELKFTAFSSPMTKIIIQELYNNRDEYADRYIKMRKNQFESFNSYKPKKDIEDQEAERIKKHFMSSNRGSLRDITIRQNEEVV
ncbi:MAG: winged helix-turn-helix transcriptional regulator [Lachnospiraceae bacterium]|nr:winged helix-turn-helix transcriptional regulator [Lachnospiraceae bacterium]